MKKLPLVLILLLTPLALMACNGINQPSTFSIQRACDPAQLLGASEHIVKVEEGASVTWTVRCSDGRVKVVGP